MEKAKLLFLFSLGILSIYAVGRISATDSVSVPELTITPPAGVSGNAGMTVYMLQSDGQQPTATQLSEIKRGVFATSGNNPVCPTTPDCGTPNTLPTKVGTATCPTLCYVQAQQLGTPPSSRPYYYPSCPKGYTVIAPGKYDLYYAFVAAQSVYPSSVTALNTYQGTGYSCATDPSTNIYSCPSPYARDTYYQLNGKLYWLTDGWCATTGCWGNVSCGVANAWSTNIQAMRCTRPAGYYPVQTQLSPYGSTMPYYQMAPQLLICGLINTQWIKG